VLVGTQDSPAGSDIELAVHRALHLYKEEKSTFIGNFNLWLKYSVVCKY